ncbi:MAG: CHAD domain-containing protein [Chloroflexi bacterium]|nr:CHAD domain-containing protein [Chloroflexota bacterium]
MEIEAKYSVPDEGVFSELLAIARLADYKFRATGDKCVTDYYLDTENRDILRGGYALRIRQGESENWKNTLKGLSGADGAIHQREEIEVETPAKAAPAEWPDGPAKDLALRLSGGQPLIELFVIQQDRIGREVKQGRRRVGLASLDTVEIEAGEHKATFHELEIELAQTGKLEDLQALGELLDPYKLEPQSLSKFERALALLDGLVESRPRKEKKKHPGVRASESIAEAGRKILRFHFERMLANEEGTRDGSDIEALHDMRVATRRQRAAFRIVASHFKRKAVRPFRDELQALAGRLGAVRDLDVLIEAASEYASALNAAEAKAFQPLLDDWSGKRNAAREALLKYLNSESYRAFKDSYAGFLETAGAGVRATDSESPKPRLVSQVLPTEIWNHYGQLQAYESILPWAPIQTLHALRIEGKRLRYLLEFFREALGPNVDETITAMVALQDHLGELHDTDVAIHLLREFLVRNAQALPLETMSAVGGYLKAREARLKTLQRTIRRPWAKVSGKHFRRALARMVAGL